MEFELRIVKIVGLNLIDDMTGKYLLGYDVGSSSVKASIVDIETGKSIASAFYPKNEAHILSIKAGWAEQEPDMWWESLKFATKDVLAQVSGAAPSSIGSSGLMPDSSEAGRNIAAIGISYQMHGLVCVDKNGFPLRPSIIWCDSRAIPYGEKALEALGETFCLEHLLNSPGNFTASKLAWVKDNEPALYQRIHKILLPGDYIAYKLTGEMCTTVSGLSEGMFWDFRKKAVSQELLSYFGFDSSILPEIKPTFAEQGRLSAAAARELGIKEGIPVTYRAGDQPNNALSLNVFEPGEVAATAGTSGVVYGVSGEVAYDPKSRVNTFAHVNHGQDKTRLGILLCINGTGILNSWVRRNIAPENVSYTRMNNIASAVPPGCDGVGILPFGNGAERMLENREVGCRIYGVNFNLTDRNYLVRAAQEGIVFAFKYGMDIMSQMGMNVNHIHAGNANLFLSPVFRQILANVTGATIDLFDTDGSAGAARGAGIGAGIYSGHNEAFASLEKISSIQPEKDSAIEDAYNLWKCELGKTLAQK